MLNLEIGGKTVVTEYDQLVVTGTATLNGTLNVTLINGFRPAVGDVFQIISSGAFTGAFSTINTTGFTGQVNYSAGAITMTVLTVPDIPLNIATRLRVNPDPNQLIGGFIITGSEPKKVIIRAIGPSLSSFFSGALADPTLELFQGNTLLESNDNWKDSPNKQAIIDSTIPPKNDLESAIVRTLAPGAYTAIVRGNGGTSGIGVVEAYDLNPAETSKLANISSRGFVQAGDDAMIGGFIAGPNTRGSTAILIRGMGPSVPVTPNLADPTLQLVNANGALIDENNDWQEDQAAAITATGIPPGNASEAAILVPTLAPGNYTAILRGANNTVGNGLVEIYNLR